MKVLLRRNVSKLGKIGEVVDVKPGYARNYLLPMSLGVAPTEANLKAVEAEKQAYLEELAKLKEELAAKAALVQGKEVTIAARANEEGLLYGSVGPAQISSALAEEKIFIDSRYIRLHEPIRKLDRYNVELEFGEDVTATIHVWVVPVREEGREEAEETKADESKD